MQLIAMLAMLVDHAGIVCFPDNPWFRCVGRLAMPLYAYALVLGYGRTRDFRRYALRLAAIAAISQLPYQYALMEPDEPFELNVVFTLFVSLIVLRLIDAAAPSGGLAHAAAANPASAGKLEAAASADAVRPREAAMPSACAGHAPSATANPASADGSRAGSALPETASGAGAIRRRLAALGIAAAGCLLLELVPCDYGSHLLLLVLIYRFSSGLAALALHVCLNLMYMAFGFPPHQMFSLLSTLLAACAPDALAALNRRLRVPRWLWRSFYPAHLAALAAVRLLAPV